MAKKRDRKASHRRIRHRVTAQKNAAASRVHSISTNIRIILNNLIIFFILFLTSLVLFTVLQSEVLRNLFFVFLLGFGFISVAFLITLVVFLFLKLFHMRRR